MVKSKLGVRTSPWDKRRLKERRKCAGSAYFHRKKCCFIFYSSALKTVLILPWGEKKKTTKKPMLVVQGSGMLRNKKIGDSNWLFLLQTGAVVGSCLLAGTFARWNGTLGSNSLSWASATSTRTHFKGFFPGWLSAGWSTVSGLLESSILFRGI